MAIRLLAVFLLLVQAVQTEQKPVSISGIVLDALTNKPVAGATLTATQITRQSQSETFRATTDEGGRFLLEGLHPLPTFTSIAKSGYLGESPQYVLTPGLNVTDVTIRLSPVGALSGRVFNTRGGPLPLARVSLLYRRVGPNGTVELTNGPNMETNDRGEFRFDDLLPDKYFVSFLADARWPNGGPRNFPSLQPPAREPGLVSLLLYPNASDLSRATAIDVKGAEEVRLPDVMLTDTRPGPVRVKLTNPSSEPPKQVGLRYIKPPVIQRQTYSWGAAIDSDLRGGNPQYGFEAAWHLAPGAELERVLWPEQFGFYEIEVSVRTDKGDMEQFVTQFTFEGTSLDVPIVLAKPEGRLTFRTSVIANDSPTPASLPSGLSVGWGGTGLVVLPGLQSRDMNPNVASGSRIARIGPTGQLDVVGVSPGRYDVFSVSGIPSDFYLAAVRQKARNVLVEGMLAGKDSDPVEFVIRQGVGVLRGKATNLAGNPVLNALVILSPEAPLSDSKLTTLRRAVRTDQTGAYEIRAVAPGAYRLYVLSAVEYPWSDRQTWAYRDKEFLKKFDGRAKPLDVRQGGEHVIDITIP